ncbi:MAG: S-methyl-5-thioribose-1-phosphate isomerase [Planctomycetota bacterium]|nr:S-methyl-5-thioribose-1-phosphate isomerase [Planctomycetota bacterium]
MSLNLVPHIEWVGDAATGHLRLLDQTRLPRETVHLDCRSVQAVWDAIKVLAVRGAPAIGVAAAYGCVIAAQGAGDARDRLARGGDHLATSRPTAVNLFWAIERMKRVRPATPEALLAEARAIHAEDAAMCLAIGEHGLPLLKLAIERTGGRGSGHGSGQGAVLTHCNAGALATGGIGTATAPMYLAHQRGLSFKVFADETRPLLQGARLTAYELQAAGIDVTLICDSMAAQVMREGKVAMIIVGADRIAANGDAANKIGTYSLAIAAKHHGVPFYVAAPHSTFDLTLPDGSGIPIEERAAAEITEGFGQRTAPVGVKTYSPAFDVTPAALITALITDRGVIEPVTTVNVRAIIGT